MIALLFAGQGVDPPWIDPDLLDRELAGVASEAAGVDVARLLVRGGPELARVEVLQPAMTAACLMAAGALARAGVRPDVVCGHSLGELAAWAAGGHVTPADAIRAAAVRGRLMAREAARQPGGMMVVHHDLERVLACGRAHGLCVHAADNTTGEQVIAGDDAALAAIAAAFHCRRLPVAGAWHSEAMAGAVDELHAVLAALPRSPGVPFVCNRDGTVAPPDDIPALIAGQLVRPIRWVAANQTLRALGVTRYVIAGPGRLVRAMLRANLGDVEIAVVAGARDLARVHR